MSPAEQIEKALDSDDVEAAEAVVQSIRTKKKLVQELEQTRLASIGICNQSRKKLVERVVRILPRATKTACERRKYSQQQERVADDLMRLVNFSMKNREGLCGGPVRCGIGPKHIREQQEGYAEDIRAELAKLDRSYGDMGTFALIAETELHCIGEFLK